MNEKEMWSHPLSMEEKRKISEYHQRVHDESNQIAQKIITVRYRLYFQPIIWQSDWEKENGIVPTKEYFHDFQIYQKQICDCLITLFSGLSGLGISGTSKRTIPGILLRHENEIRQMFNEQLPLSVAIKECIHRFYHTEILLCPRKLIKLKQYSMNEQDKKKIESTDKNRLNFRIDNLYSGLGDHNRVQIFVNRVNILLSSESVVYLGVQPEKMLQTDLMQPGKCLIGMCSCGDERCDPYYVDISINDDMVIWNDPQAKCQYKFDKMEYKLSIKKLKKMLTAYVSNTPYKPTKEDLKEYKKEIYEWLTEKKKIPEARAKSGMKYYEEFFEEEFFMKHKSAQVAAISILKPFPLSFVQKIIKQKMHTRHLSNTSCKPTKKDLENFKKEVYDYLTTQLGASIVTAKSLMKDYEIDFERLLEDNWSILIVATVIWHNFLIQNRHERTKRHKHSGNY